MVIVGNVPIPYDSAHPLNGSFAYLQKITDIKDIVFNKIVKVRVSSTNNSNLAVPLIETNETANIFWLSKDIDSNFYEVDFVDNFFRLESFVIRFHKNDFMSQWSILGSNDGIHYETLFNASDYRSNINGYGNFHFNCSKIATKRIFRYETHGVRKVNDYYTYLHRLQFYGSFIDPTLMVKTCNLKSFFSLNSIFPLLFILIFL